MIVSHFTAEFFYLWSSQFLQCKSCVFGVHIYFMFYCEHITNSNTLTFVNIWLLGIIYVLNPLKPSVIVQLQFKCSAPYRPNLPFLLPTFGHSAAQLRAERQSARMSEIKTVG